MVTVNVTTLTDICHLSCVFLFRVGEGRDGYRRRGKQTWSSCHFRTRQVHLPARSPSTPQSSGLCNISPTPSTLFELLRALGQMCVFISSTLQGHRHGWMGHGHVWPIHPREPSSSSVPLVLAPPLLTFLFPSQVPALDLKTQTHSLKKTASLAPTIA